MLFLRASCLKRSVSSTQHVILNSASSRVKDRTTVSTAMQARGIFALRAEWADPIYRIEGGH
jgi:hypothetical protein